MKFRALLIAAPFFFNYYFVFSLFRISNVRDSILPFLIFILFIYPTYHSSSPLILASLSLSATSSPTSNAKLLCLREFGQWKRGKAWLIPRSAVCLNLRPHSAPTHPPGEIQISCSVEFEFTQSTDLRFATDELCGDAFCTLGKSGDLHCRL